LNKIHNILVIAAFFLALNIHGQQFGSNVIGVEKGSAVSLENTFKPDVSVTLGTSFTSFGQGFNAFGTYIMPEVTMPVSKKFSIRAGLGYSSMFISTPENTGSIFGQNNSQYGTVYVSGLYQVNPKLRIAGTAFKTFDVAPRNNELNPRALDFSNEGLMIDVEYKVSDHFRINAGFSYQKRNPYNYFYNPAGYNMHPSPFQNNGFGSGFGPGF
jgi:hypothetical protein